ERPRDEQLVDPPQQAKVIVVGRRQRPPGRSSFWSRRHGPSKAATAIARPATSVRSNGCTPRSATMDGSFCVAALQEALPRFGRPDIFNTDQGSQFTSAAFTGMLMAAGVRISMDGRGRWMDNVFIERLWRSLKHEDVNLIGMRLIALGQVGHRFLFP